jgi:hypothetical protein
MIQSTSENERIVLYPNIFASILIQPYPACQQLLHHALLYLLVLPALGIQGRQFVIHGGEDGGDGLLL